MPMMTILDFLDGRGRFTISHYGVDSMSAYGIKTESEVTEPSMDAKKLTTKARKKLSKSSFALPGKKYPIEDRNHAENALARVSQNGSPAQKSTVRRKVHQRYPGTGISSGHDSSEDCSEDSSD